MTFESSAFNSTDVVRNHYGPRKIKDFGGHVSTEGKYKQVELVIDLAEEISGAPATSNALLDPAKGKMEALIPAYAVINSARVTVLEALSTTGGSAAATASIQVGLDSAVTGTAINADGLIDATDGDLTIASNDIAEPLGTVLTGSNAALVPNVGIGAVAGQLYAALVIDDITDMTAVAGKVSVLVEYMDAEVDATGNYTAGGVLGA